MLLAEHVIHHDLEVVTRVPVAVEIDGSSLLEDPSDLHNPLAHPLDVDLDTARPTVFEGPDLGLVAPDHLVVTI